jgi:hypothetical protein
MELPHQYPYNPRLRLVLFVLGTGLLWIVVQWLSWGRLPTGFSLWFALVPITLAVILAVRRISVERYLLLDNDCMVLPTGLFQKGTTRIPHSSIVRIWRHYLPMTVVLRVATQKRTFNIVSVVMPDNESYRALEGFLIVKAQENATQKSRTNLN